jgi:hypothetical protein
MVLVVFAIIAIIGQVLNVAVCLALDQIFNPTVGALSFVVLYMLVFAGAWLISVRIAERRQGVAPAQPALAGPGRQQAREEWRPSIVGRR